jgi:hypothetical protein
MESLRVPDLGPLAPVAGLSHGPRCRSEMSGLFICLSAALLSSTGARWLEKRGFVLV